MPKSSKTAPLRHAAPKGGSALKRMNRSSAKHVVGAGRAGGMPSVSRIAAHLGSGSVIRSSGSEKSVRETGTDWITDVQITSSTTNDSVVVNWWISPTMVNGRLASIARQWERWMPKALKFKYVSLQPATVAGAITMWHDPDVDDDTPAAPIMGSAFAVDSFVSGNVWESFDLPIRSLDSKTLLYTRDRGAGEADDRLEFSGQLYVAYTGPAVSTVTTLGRILIEYDLEFSKRCWEDAPGIAMPPSIDPITITESIGALVSAAKAAGKLLSDSGINVTDKGIELKPGEQGWWRFVTNVLPTAATATAAVGNFYAVLRRTADLLEAHPHMWKTAGDYTTVSSFDKAGYTNTVVGRNAVAFSAPWAINETFVNYIFVRNTLTYPVYLDWKCNWGAATDTASVVVTGIFVNSVDVDIITPSQFSEHAIDSGDTAFMQSSQLTWGAAEEFDRSVQESLSEHMAAVYPSGYIAVTPPACTAVMPSPIGVASAAAAAHPTTLTQSTSTGGPGFLSRLVR